MSRVPWATQSKKIWSWSFWHANHCQCTSNRWIWVSPSKVQHCSLDDHLRIFFWQHHGLTVTSWDVKVWTKAAHFDPKWSLSRKKKQTSKDCEPQTWLKGMRYFQNGCGPKHLEPTQKSHATVTSKNIQDSFNFCSQRMVFHVVIQFLIRDRSQIKSRNFPHRPSWKGVKPQTRLSALCLLNRISSLYGS